MAWWLWQGLNPKDNTSEVLASPSGPLTLSFVPLVFRISSLTQHSPRAPMNLQDGMYAKTTAAEVNQGHVIETHLEIRYKKAAYASMFARPAVRVRWGSLLPTPSPPQHQSLYFLYFFSFIVTLQPLWALNSFSLCVIIILMLTWTCLFLSLLRHVKLTSQHIFY